jgi:signal transduction histidine kinase
MNIKRRLIISNAAIVVIPIIITIVASFAFVYISTRMFDAEISYQDIKRLAEIEYELLKAGEGQLQGKPQLLLEKEFQQYIAAKISNIGADVVILKEYETVFSTKKLSKIDIEKCLEANSGSFNSTLKISGTSYTIRVINAKFQDGDQGYVILLAPISNAEALSKYFLLFVAITFLISFTVINILLAVAFSKSLLNPLKRLKVAAGEISSGNLDYEIIESGDEEIRELCRAFEQMRLKLKESVYKQMEYDDNRKTLVSSISHDLKTPITSIKGYVEGIVDGVANTPEKVQKYLKTVYSKATQIDAMIDDLLLYSKLDLKQIPFNLEKTDVIKYFEDIIIENEAEMEKASIKLKLHIKLDGVRYAMIDRERMQRVVVNILDNARKYMARPEGRIDAILRETAVSIIFEVKDNGSGIAQEDMKRIFDRFYRADASRGIAGGSGLGLAIAKQIVEGHGGKIWVRSRKNEGTSTMISLKKL